MEASSEILQALTHSIHSLSSALRSGSGEGYFLPIITGLIGVFSGLIVVTIQSTRADQRALAQRDEERKRDVYKQAANELARLPKHITSLRQMTEGKAADGDEIISMSAILAQVVQVSTAETAKLAIKLSSQINQTGLSAVQQLFPLNNLQSELNVVTQELERIQEFSGKITGMLQESKVSNNLNDEGRQYLYDSAIISQENISTLLKRQHQLSIEVSREQVKYLKWCRENLRTPLDNCFDLQIQIRKEFGLPDGKQSSAIWLY